MSTSIDCTTRTEPDFDSVQLNYSRRNSAAASADPFAIPVFETIVIAGNFLPLYTVAILVTYDVFTLYPVNGRIRRGSIVDALRSNSRYVVNHIRIRLIKLERNKLHPHP